MVNMLQKHCCPMISNRALSCGNIESSGYVQAELHVVVIKEHVLLMIYITARSITQAEFYKKLNTGSNCEQN